jgi:hypothetical protein
VEVDWSLRIVGRQDPAVTTRRQQRVKLRVTKTGRKWQIVALEPMEFFAPPRM